VCVNLPPPLQVCAKADDKVQFVSPPEGAPLGEVVQFEGMPATIPASSAQVEKKKMFLGVMDKLKTNEAFEGTWDGHRFMTSAGACKCVNIAGGQMA